MTPENWKLVLAFGGLFLTTVTGPILWALRAESRRVQAEIQRQGAEIALTMEKLKNELKTEITGIRTELKTDIAGVKTELKDAESRLNQRIDTRLVHH